jgi:hypothetical protein
MIIIYNKKSPKSLKFKEDLGDCWELIPELCCQTNGSTYTDKILQFANQIYAK